MQLHIWFRSYTICWDRMIFIVIQKIKNGLFIVIQKIFWNYCITKNRLLICIDIRIIVIQKIKNGLFCHFFAQKPGFLPLFIYLYKNSIYWIYIYINKIGKSFVFLCNCCITIIQHVFERSFYVQKSK